MILRWFIVIFSALLSVAPRLCFINVPFERDEGAYAYIADTISRGGVPYLNAFDHKPPGVYYLYHLAFRLFGHDVYGPRIMALIFMFLACILAFKIVHRITSSFPAGLMTIAFLGLATVSPAYTGFNANTEIFTVVFILAGVLLLLDDEPAPARYLLAGLMFGSALMIKQSVITIACLTFVCSILRIRHNMGRFLQCSMLYALGSIIPFILFLVFFAANNALGQFWTGFLGFNFGYMSVQSSRLGWPRFVGALTNFVKLDPITWLAGLAGLIVFYVNYRKYNSWLVAAALTGAAASVAMGKYFFGHYFIFFVPFLAIGAGLGVGVLCSGGLKKQALIGGTLVLVAAIGINLRYFRMTSEEILKLSYGSAMFSQSAFLGDYLKSLPAEEKTAYVVGSEPEILFYGGLVSPTRFYYSHTLLIPTAYTAAFRKEALADLRRSMPYYLIVVRNPDAHFPFADAPDQYYRPIRDLFAGYQLVGLNVMYDDRIYSRNDVSHNSELLGRRDAILVFHRAGSSQDDQSLSYGALAN